MRGVVDSSVIRYKSVERLCGEPQCGIRIAVVVPFPLFVRLPSYKREHEPVVHDVRREVTVGRICWRLA